MERITERNFEMMSGKYQKEQLETEARLKEVTENGGQHCRPKTVRCAALSMSQALACQSIALFVPEK